MAYSKVVVYSLTFVSEMFSFSKRIDFFSRSSLRLLWVVQPFLVQVDVGTGNYPCQSIPPSKFTVCESIDGVTDLNTLCHLKAQIMKHNCHTPVFYTFRNHKESQFAKLSAGNVHTTHSTMCRKIGVATLCAVTNVCAC
jgi:hypothetical protein